MGNGGPRVPVTIVGGYLGAGKTTLLNQVLAHPGGRRLAVLVNDFGSIAVDAALIESNQGDTIALTNGCVCCSIADALGDALDRVLAAQPAPDHILIETSGAADPAQVAMYGQGWPGCRLDTVAVVADATMVRAQADDPFTGSLVGRQLRAADVVVASKVDLLPEVERATVATWLGRASGGAPVVDAPHGRLDPTLLFEPLGSGPRPRPRPQAGGLTPEGPPDQHPPLQHELLEVEADLGLDPYGSGADELAAAVAALPASVARVKGFVIDRAGVTHLVQRVGRRTTVEPWTGAGPVPGAGRLDVISISPPADQRARPER